MSANIYKRLLTSAADANAAFKSAKPFSEIPGPRSWPIFGSTLEFRGPFGRYTVEGYKEAIADLQRRFGDVVKMEGGFGRGPSLLIFAPTDAQAVFAAEGKSPHVTPLQETTQLYREMRELSLGLGNMNGPEWYRLRSATQQAMMQPRAVQQYLPLINQVSADFVRDIERRRSASTAEPPSFERLVARWSLESSGLLTFERRLGALEGDGADWGGRMIHWNREIFRLGGHLKFKLPLYRYVSTPAWKALVAAEDAFYGESEKLVQEALVEMGRAGQSRDLNFMGYLASRKELSPKDVSIITLSLFADGLNTTAPALIYNLYTLAKNPKIQDQLREELRAVIGAWDAEMGVEQLNKLSLLRACIRETFRLFPVGTEVSRIPQSDLVLGGFQVPAQTPVDLCLGPACVSEANFTDPLAFRPQRWIRGGPEYVGRQLHPFLHIPFGHGPRMCAGRRFAEQDLQVTLSRLVLRFGVGHSGGELGQRMLTLLLPKGPTQFAFRDL